MLFACSTVGELTLRVAATGQDLWQRKLGFPTCVWCNIFLIEALVRARTPCSRRCGNVKLLDFIGLFNLRKQGDRKLLLQETNGVVVNMVSRL